MSVHFPSFVVLRVGSLERLSFMLKRINREFQLVRHEVVLKIPTETRAFRNSGVTEHDTAPLCPKQATTPIKSIQIQVR